MQRYLKLAWMFPVWLAITICSPAWAGEAAPAGPRLEVQTGFLNHEEISGFHGRYSVGLLGASLAYGPLKLQAQERQYSWEDEQIGRLPFGNQKDRPWRHLRHLELSAGHQAQINDTWSWGAEAGALAAFEEQFGGYGGRLRAWAGYTLQPGLRLRLGGQGHAYQAGLLVLIPELALEYHLERTQGLSASLGIPEAFVKYAFSPRAGLRLAAWLDRDLYRLDDQSTVSPEGYLQSWRYQSGLFLDLRPLPGLEINLGLTRSLGGTLTTYDKDGDNSKEYDLDGAWGGLLSLSYRF